MGTNEFIKKYGIDFGRFSIYGLIATIIFLIPIYTFLQKQGWFPVVQRDLAAIETTLNAMELEKEQYQALLSSIEQEYKGLRVEVDTIQTRLDRIIPVFFGHFKIDGHPVMSERVKDHARRLDKLERR